MGEVEALMNIFEMAIRCRGPHGRHAMVMKGKPCSFCTATSLGTKIFEGIQDPLIRLLVASTVIPQHQAWGDGSLLCIALAARLSAFGIEVSKSMHSRLAIGAAYKTALQWCFDYLDCEIEDENKASTLSILNLDWGNLQSVLKLAASIIGSKPVSALNKSASDMLCAAVVAAFLSSLETREATKVPYPHVKFVGVVGSPASASQCIAGALLDASLPCGAETLMPVEGTKVALFNVNLAPDNHLLPANDFKMLHLDEDDKLQAVEGLHGKGDEFHLEMKQLLKIVTHLKELGVGIVACQKVIHPEMSHALVVAGILPLPRLSLRHIDSVVLCTGAVPISNTAGRGWEGKLGSVSRAELFRVGTKDFVHLVPDAHVSRAQTVTICGLTESSVDEAKAVAESCIKVLWMALKEPKLVQGCGAAERNLASEMQRRLLNAKPNHGALEHRALCTFVDALNSIASTQTLETPKELAFFKEDDNHDHNSVLDLLGAKKSALSLAVATTCTLLRISDIIVES